MSKATWAWSDYKWTAIANGNRWRYTATRHLTWPTGKTSDSGQEVLLATVTRNADTKQATFNKWFVHIIGSLDKPMFDTKNKAVAWATAIVHLNQ